MGNGSPPSWLGEASALMNSDEVNSSSPWQPGAACGAVRERGHAGLAALTEAGDTAMQGTAGSGS